MPFLDPEELKPKLREVFETVVIPQIKKAKMKQTAVEWLIEQIFNEIDLKDSILKLAINQAKAMEKEQIMNAFEAAEKDCGRDFLHGDLYYNETFKSE